VAIIIGNYLRGYAMSWLNWASVLFVFVGLGLFLYGANVYNAVIGWTGFCLGIAGILLGVFTYLYDWLKKEPKQPTV
jgi:drug/metabolite transporter (DMT)-like permease